jgi:hypothetical protein
VHLGDGDTVRDDVDRWLMPHPTATARQEKGRLDERVKNP